MLSEKIAVIDDDPRIIKSLEMALNAYDIIAFTDSEKAFEFFQKPRDIHLVLLDVMMPKINGLSILEQIKKVHKHAIVIMMTAYGTKDVVIQALRHHADDFIEKPFKAEALKIKIRNFLKQQFYVHKNVDDKAFKVERMKSFIQRNYNRVSLEEMAEELCLSPKYISRIFKECTGVSYRDFHLEIKMKMAKELLQNTSFNVDEIAYKLGYQNPESFMRIFKQLTSVTPSEYREKSKKQKLSCK